MVQTIAVTEAITNLNDAHQRFGLSRVSNSAFFPQWQESLPALSAVEQAALDKDCDRYLNLSSTEIKSRKPC